MAQPYRRRAVTFANRAYSRDPFERIEKIGGVNSDHTRWALSQTDAIAAIEAGTDEFFMATGDRSVKLIVVSHQGEKYLNTERVKTHPDDLLSLPRG
jgi:hypothetical protein